MTTSNGLEENRCLPQCKKLIMNYNELIFNMVDRWRTYPHIVGLSNIVEGKLVTDLKENRYVSDIYIYIYPALILIWALVH